MFSIKLSFPPFLWVFAYCQTKSLFPSKNTEPADIDIRFEVTKSIETCYIIRQLKAEFLNVFFFRIDYNCFVIKKIGPGEKWEFSCNICWWEISKMCIFFINRKWGEKMLHLASTDGQQFSLEGTIWTYSNSHVV